jgi:hypothetical protein
MIRETEEEAEVESSANGTKPLELIMIRVGSSYGAFQNKK